MPECTNTYTLGEGGGGIGCFWNIYAGSKQIYEVCVQKSTSKFELLKKLLIIYQKSSEKMSNIHIYVHIHPHWGEVEGV